MTTTAQKEEKRRQNEEKQHAMAMEMERRRERGDVMLFGNVTVEQALPFVAVIGVWYVGVASLHDEKDIIVLTICTLLAAVLPKINFSTRHRDEN